MQNVVYIVYILKGTSEKPVQSSKSEKTWENETFEVHLKRVGWNI